MSEHTPTAKADTSAPAPKANLSATIKSLQFAWFAGHVLTTIATVGYFVSYFGLYLIIPYARALPNPYKFWYKVALVGVVQSFGVLIFQTVKKNGTNIKVLAKEDNVQYLFLGLVLLFFSPYVLLTLSTFFLFSTFHVLSYTTHYLLPALHIPDTHPLSVHLSNFVAANNNKSIGLASLLEVYTLVWLFVRVLAFRPVSVVPFLAYVVFIKLRFEKSAYTRNAFKSLELRVEDVVTKSGSPVAKNGWVQAKGVFSRIAAVHILNDYTKEKAT